MLSLFSFSCLTNTAIIYVILYRCMSCVNSNFDCVWCVEDNMCTYQSQATSYCPQTNVQRINVSRYFLCLYYFGIKVVWKALGVKFTNTFCAWFIQPYCIGLVKFSIIQQLWVLNPAPSALQSSDVRWYFGLCEEKQFFPLSLIKNLQWFEIRRSLVCDSFKLVFLSKVYCERA